jgi:hypothetical protein
MVPDEDIDESAKTEEIKKALMEVIGKDRTELREKMLHAIADLCSDHPTFDELEALPFRHQEAFSGWIAGVFLVPQPLTPATNGLVAGGATGPSSTLLRGN